MSKAVGDLIGTHKPLNLRLRMSCSTPILFVMHGVKRDADKYFSKMLKKDLPQKFGFTLICPEFSKVCDVLSL